MFDDNYKEVYFDKYCVSCKHFLKLEEEAPCCGCLECPINLHSHKPINYEEED